MTSPSPLRLYHAAPQPVSRFRPGTSESLGVHLGTQDQARARARHAGIGSEGVLIAVDAPFERSLRLVDNMQWRPYSVWSQIKQQFPELDEQRDFVGSARGLRALIQRLGFDSVVYLNRFEGVATDAINVGAHLAIYGPSRLSDAAFQERFPAASDSYIAMDPKVLTIADTQPLAASPAKRPKP